MLSPIEQIKEKLDIIDLIQSYIKLDKAGVNFKSVCPFHKEKTPSFYVSPGRQIWHCFGCSRGGDHFRFVMEMEKVEFPESLRILAKMTGVKLQKVDEKLAAQKTRLSEILNKAKEFYKENFKRRSDVKEYLKERGLKDKTIETFEIGYAMPNWDEIYEFLSQGGFSKEEIENSGLVVKKEEAGSVSYYDRFRARIMFPIFNQLGETIGFSGRIFEKDLRKDLKEEEKPAKYINTPNTLLYDKSKALYGLNFAKNEIRKNNFCVLVEGQMDVIMSHQAGFLNTVAVSGTALTEDQLAKLKRLSPNLYIALDPDAGGIAATKRGVDLALKNNFDVKILPIDKDDPADIIKENPETWLLAIKRAKPIIRYYLDFLSEKVKEKRELAKETERVIIPYIANIASNIEQAHWLKEVAVFLSLKEEAVWQSLAKYSKKLKRGNSDSAESVETENSRKPSSVSRRDLLEEKLIGILLWKKELAAFFNKDWQNYFSPARKFILEKALNSGTEIASEHYLNKLALEAELYYSNLDKPEEELNKLAMELKREYLKDELLSLSQKIRECEIAGDGENIKKCLDEFHKLSKELNV
ncbi:MAG: DNA primase [Candidatus Niyogibacteria bacterium RIFCSPLOWO2_12_FULL_41_13]|uniref:DNA primase n=1 Tax=Candidatus Niyogibacteria bacterium RIFCSPLOWO2_12_FULL_41_13 TaxID=1801726 RepID=A0A1G2F3H9_9BACT|nr:MAG: DNA primase [Candidatus Niyogibacteria bacterium RIFCSPLOWO2_12_FULL_41_13]